MCLKKRPEPACKSVQGFIILRQTTESPFSFEKAGYSAPWQGNLPVLLYPAGSRFLLPACQVQNAGRFYHWPVDESCWTLSKALLQAIKAVEVFSIVNKNLKLFGYPLIASILLSKLCSQHKESTSVFGLHILVYAKTAAGCLKAAGRHIKNRNNWKTAAF